MSQSTVIVVGAGAAGIIAAWRAACLVSRVLLLEKTPRLGTKILISGGGKCNITHDGPIEDVLKAFHPKEALFLRPACYRFTNTDIVEMLTTRGLEVYTRPDGRIFPVNQTAKAVVSILKDYLVEAGVEIATNKPVTGLLMSDGSVHGVQCASERIEGSSVVVSVGGSSYPNSGTTGDGWDWAQSCGHTIEPVRAALAPIDTDSSIGRFPGVALRDVLLKARLAGREVARWRADLLFTHHGVSGPAALDISRVVAERMVDGSIGLEVDLYPDRTFEQLGEYLRQFIETNRTRPMGKFLEGVVPAALVEPAVYSAGISRETAAAQVDRKARNRFIEVLKGWPIGTVTNVPLEKGECVAGGVSLQEVDPHTMRSSKVKGLYLCGEILDIAGPVGGYNLQAAFATGFVAGESCAQP